MEKQKKWQLVLILTVVVLTIYNILPTVFFYAKPLNAPVGESRANDVSLSIVQRVNELEPQATDWIKSFCKLLSIKPQSVNISSENPDLISIAFASASDANTFRHYLPRAGALIPFAPAQLSLYSSTVDESKTILVKRKIPVHLDASQTNSFIQYSAKKDTQGKITPLYHALVDDRVLEIAMTMGGVAENAQYVQAVVSNDDKALVQDLSIALCQNIASFTSAFGEQSDIAKRYFASFSQSETSNKAGLIDNFLSKLENLKSQVQSDKNKILTEEKELRSQEKFLDSSLQQQLQLLTNREKLISSTLDIIKRNQSFFSAGPHPWNYAALGANLQKSLSQTPIGSNTQDLSLDGKNPFFEKIVIDWSKEALLLVPYKDVVAYQKSLEANPSLSVKNDKVNQLIFNEIAYLNRHTEEKVEWQNNLFEIPLSTLSNSKSFIALRLGFMAQAQVDEIKQALLTNWNPSHPDLKKDAFPVWDYEQYISLPMNQKKLGLLIYSPVTQQKSPEPGFRMNSLYVVAKGVDRILQQYRAETQSEQAQQFIKDFQKLREILQRNGFVGYSGSAFPLSKEFQGDFIFEAPDYYQSMLLATREDFAVHGTKRYAILEFSDVEQRILTENKIGTRIHEDLLKWRDDYQAAQLNIKGVSQYDVPKPTQSPFWSNLQLSAVKYFRGDDRKILHWGLDLSGGKTVQLELKDQSNRTVTTEADIKQAINELYSRVNKMGVSEVSIRQEGHYITLDFPGSQNLSAEELVKASSMYFHVVNEKFTSNNSALSEHVNRFLQEVWNEAIVTNKKTPEQINQIAWNHLYGDSVDPNVIQPRSESARILYENGLRFANPQDTDISSTFDNTYSSIALYRGDDYTKWYGQTHPLLVVFRNFALEGSNLENVHASYDPSRGNFLGFGVKSKYSNKENNKLNPRDDFFAWTSPFSKEKISGTANETYSKKHGWRMAVVLNGSIVSAPTLDSPLSDSAMITGSFSQREINQLEADLKAGSLSFTPHILSEKNVSPELGSREKSLGIWATVIALVLVIGSMIGYYHFGGIVASIAVVFNILIMWATLQNIQATLTLASIAGLILTVGMAVDANVLVFERIREEFAVTGRIASAIHAGYRKAFSAIVDSNVTTIIAALILLHFDSGPIKGFAVTLIIGIISSMFTALFMTRYFFAGWVQNPLNKKLSMVNLFKARNFNFLKFTKPTIILSSLVIVAGGIALTLQRHSILGMDFTGGYTMNVEVVPHQGANYRMEIEKALLAAGVKSQEIQIRELTPSNNIKIFLSRSLDQSGRPFARLGAPSAQVPFVYGGENAKIDWVVKALAQSHIDLSPSTLQTLDGSWSEVSGQMSDTMRNNAIIGLLIALACIMIYITLRFEFKYAISATLCLAHDIVFTVGVLALLHLLHVPLQIDLNIIAALMTIVGYSLNDTIIVFDRIREDVRVMKRASFTDIINHAINITLSRTIMTSGTTLLVLLPLILLGGSTIFGFSLVMAIGVLFGTLSSLFIAAPLMLYFHNKELAKEQGVATNSPIR